MPLHSKKPENDDAPYWYGLNGELGWIRLGANENGITSAIFRDYDPGRSETIPGHLQACIDQVKEYLAGHRKTFELPLRPAGTEFQIGVWNALQGIAFGTTRSYLDVAMALNNRKAVRAVGAANGSNPISIIVPCHRVIGANGDLTGYGGEIWRKKWLLAHEQKVLYGTQASLF
jgi:methylated-DNA-[protein]-cysteine S-methyltransferase